MAILTEELAKRTALPAGGQLLIYDEETKGLGLRLTKTTRSWIVEVHQHRRSRRATLGKVGDLSLKTARRMALEEKLKGVADTRVRKGRPATVRELWEKVKTDKRHRVRTGTMANYEFVLGEPYRPGDRQARADGGHD